MRIMALDVGNKRIGVAITDPLNIFVQPYDVITRSGGPEDISHVLDLLKENRITTLVIGIPYGDEGELTPYARKISGFKDRIEKAITNAGMKVVVETWDETMTTIDAHEEMKNAGIKHSKRKKVIDKMAAVMILKSWMMARRS